MRFPLEIQRDQKTRLAQHAKVIARDTTGETLMFADPKFWTLSEAVEVYRDESRNDLLFHISQSWDQTGSKIYRFVSQESGCNFLTVRIPIAETTMFSRLWSVNYEILDDEETMIINQESSTNQLLQFLFGPLPSVCGACPSLLVRRPDGTPVVRMKRRRGFAERYIIVKIGQISIDALYRSVLSLVLHVIVTKEGLYL